MRKLLIKAALVLPIAAATTASVMAVPSWTINVARGANTTGIPIKLGAITGNVTAGVFNADPVGAWTPDPQAFPDVNFQTYCTDIIPHFAASNDYDPTPFATATGVNPLWVAGGIQKAAYLYENRVALMAGTGHTPAVENAALQLAIWETLYDTTLNIGGGNFYVRASAAGDALLAKSDAATYLAAIPGLFAIHAGSWLAPHIDKGEAPYQGLIITPRPRVPDGGLTIALLGMGLTGVSLLGRKFRA
jgi:hypothetical protein